MKTVIVNIPDKDEAFFSALLKKFHFKTRFLTSREMEDKALAKRIDAAMKSEDVSEEQIFEVFRKHGIKV